MIGFLISPVRQSNPEVEKKIRARIADLEEHGWEIHYPLDDTPQEDPDGWHICEYNRKTMERADRVFIWWSPDSKGSLFDLGMAFAMGKSIAVLNQEALYEENTGKSFEAVMRVWEMFYQ